MDGLNALLNGLPQRTLAPLQRVQNCAAMLVTRTPRREHISPVLRHLHWLPISTGIKSKVILLTYQCVYGFAPSYLQELVTLYRPSRSLRSADKLLLTQPHLRTTSFGNRAFSCAAPCLWNTLPQSIRESATVSVFKRRLKTLLFSESV